MNLRTTEHRPRETDQPAIELLQKVLDRAQIKTWDVLLVGDGSGNGWDQPCGWAGILIDNELRLRRMDYGAMNPGSINFAEVMPYVQALNWLDNNGGRRRLKDRGVIRVHVLTDSAVVARWGTIAADLNQPLPRKHILLWAGMRELARCGYVINYHWAPRSSSMLNWAADLIAGLSRRAIIGAGSQPQADEDIRRKAEAAIASIRFEDPRSGEAISIYNLNPYEDD